MHHYHSSHVQSLTLLENKGSPQKSLHDKERMDSFLRSEEDEPLVLDTTLEEMKQIEHINQMSRRNRALSQLRESGGEKKGEQQNRNNFPFSNMYQLQSTQPRQGPNMYTQQTKPQRPISIMKAQVQDIEKILKDGDVRNILGHGSPLKDETVIKFQPNSTAHVKSRISRKNQAKFMMM
ncbi:hypothetical protein FGO68_gene11822 [Halteria grandinella]|uniref:Uncharacterized protein n=1 Tax=Halteria grandinella TaxID=5974 RepID=A0A8J8P330_HALGN|nr:hypothetical protein FGO68_gene11822 [Halteria grandinella]